MAARNYKNFAQTFVATAPSPATSGTSLDVYAGTGASFPTAPFTGIVHPAGQIPNSANAEVVLVSAKSTDTFTITRAQENSTARTIVAGDILVHGITALDLTEARGFTLTGGHGAWSPTDGVTHYWGCFELFSPGATAGLARIPVPRDCVVKRVALTTIIATTNGSAETVSLSLVVNSTAHLLSSAVVYNGGVGVQGEAVLTGLSIALSAGDRIEFKEVCPTWATNPAGIYKRVDIYCE